MNEGYDAEEAKAQARAREVRPTFKELKSIERHRREILLRMR
eukprot:CAMPEP_0172548628 /NCGR_PEP_ID=MMETSP1067-20121228/17875_1 /TAXON_ID=265564 ORGANISM="Thalassiosira punctigera, Strain Tpunct2005C2" /NCGR_SAMPLE_ID=MMETSP1067 /ASSEMBLY_ACC=CAM_ASM_000444 /LENGTH=41 /DNA_ID= /DNA_START= /DNA_END= /DNA_ORIENTATION=